MMPRKFSCGFEEDDDGRREEKEKEKRKEKEKKREKRREEKQEGRATKPCPAGNPVPDLARLSSNLVPHLETL